MEASDVQILSGELKATFPDPVPLMYTVECTTTSPEGDLQLSHTTGGQEEEGTITVVDSDGIRLASAESKTAADGSTEVWKKEM